MTLSLTALKLETDVTYKDLTLQDWKDKSEYRGITRRSQKDFDNLIPMYARKIAMLRFDLAGEWDFSCKVSDDGKKLNSDAEIFDAVMQKMDDWHDANDKEQRLVDKFATCLKEVQMRKDGDVVRIDLHDQIDLYLDHSNASGTITGTWTFTNGSKDVTAAANGNAQAELAVGDYIQPGDNQAEWYRIATVTDDDNLILQFNWKQSTITDSIGATRNSDISVNDGTTISKALVHLRAYTSDLVHTAGDVLFVRAAKTYVIASTIIPFDENGSVDAYISVIGCDAVTNDPFSDSSDVLPIFDFESQNFNMDFNADAFWWLERFDLRNSGDGGGQIGASTTTRGLYFKNLNIHDAVSIGIRTVGADWVIDDCTFADNGSRAIDIEYGTGLIKNCTITAGVGGTSYGVYSPHSGTVQIQDTTFSGGFTDDIFYVIGTWIYARNVTWSGNGYRFPTTTGNGFLYSEDDEETFESHIGSFTQGTIERDTGTVRGGGADSSAKMTSNASCGLIYPLTLSGNNVFGHDFAVWVTKDIEINISIYAKVGSAWDSALAANEVYAKYSWLNHAVDATRTEVQSTEQISNDPGDVNDGWTEFTSGNFTPLQTGWVYITFYLAGFEDATEHIFVDIKPVIS